MCLFAKTQLPRAAQCPSRLGFHHPLLHHNQPRMQAANGRRPMQLNAVIMQDAALHSQMPAPRQRSSSMSQPDNSSSGSLATPAQASSLQVEVHFEVQYGCEFGQHLSIIGTPQGWQTSAAAAMTWSEGNVWKAVLSVPVGTDIEYKYLVVWDDGNVARWQDGPNNKLSVQHPGVLMQVQDTWAQQERSVREVGPRLNHNQHNKQAGGHTSPAASPAAAASAQAAAPAAADLPAAATAAAVTVLPVQPAWGGVLQSHSLLLDAFDSTAAAAAEQDEDHLQYEAGIEEEDDQQWPAKILQKAAAAGQQPLAGSAPSPAAAAAAAAGQPQQTAAAAPASAHAHGHSHSHHAHHGKHTQLQQQQAATANLAELLPLLQTELQSALEELAKHPEAAQEHGGLLSEGQTVLAALQQQVSVQSPRSSSSSSGAAGSASSSSSSSSRSPGRSPSATLTSGDEIAAALLSDDCEEACFCMVDAICSCSDWDLNCSCEDDPDTPCELPDGDEEAEAVAPHMHAAPAAAHQPAVQAAGHAPASAAAAGEWSSSTAAPSAISVAELARAAAIAATHDPAVLATRAAVFTDVQTALEKSAQLLLALSDPCHPLLLEADRNLATASRQLHSGHLLN